MVTNVYLTYDGTLKAGIKSIQKIVLEFLYYVLKIFFIIKPFGIFLKLIKVFFFNKHLIFVALILRRIKNIPKCYIQDLELTKPDIFTMLKYQLI